MLEPGEGIRTLSNAIYRFGEGLVANTRLRVSSNPSSRRFMVVELDRNQVMALASRVRYLTVHCPFSLTFESQLYTLLSRYVYYYSCNKKYPFQVYAFINNCNYSNVKIDIYLVRRLNYLTPIKFPINHEIPNESNHLHFEVTSFTKAHESQQLVI